MSRRWLTSCLSEYHRSTVSSASFKDTFQSLLRPKAVFPYAMLKLSTLALRRSLANFSFRRGTGGLPTPSHSSRQSPAATDRVTAGDSRGDSQSHSQQAVPGSHRQGYCWRQQRRLSKSLPASSFPLRGQRPQWTQSPCLGANLAGQQCRYGQDSARHFTHSLLWQGPGQAWY